MIGQETLLVTLVRLVDRLPVPPPSKRLRGRPKPYPDRLFLKALIIMIVRHLHTVHELHSVLEQETTEMQTLQTLLTIDGDLGGWKAVNDMGTSLEALARQLACPDWLLGTYAGRANPAVGDVWPRCRD